MPLGPNVMEDGPVPLCFEKVTVLLSPAFLLTEKVTVFSVVALDLGGNRGVWSSVATYLSTEINATSSLPPCRVPLGKVELDKSSI